MIGAAKIRDVLDKNKLQGIMLTSTPSIYYASGFTGSNAIVLITGDGQYLFTDSRYTLQAAEQTKDFEVVTCRDGLIKGFSGMKFSSLGFEANNITYKQYKAIKEELPACALHDCEALISALRCVKGAEEVSRIKKSIDLADRAFSHICGYVNVGVSEIEVALEIEHFMRKNGADRLAFDTIVASGSRSAMPHAQPDTKKIENGDFVVLDFGCVVDGYCSDITRTLMMGEPNERQMRIYNAVLQAQNAAIESIKPGIPANEVDNIARECLKSYDLEKHFTHSLGHGVGVEVHEEIRLSNRVGTLLKAGMVLTVEPGVYISGFGGVRIEDLIHVTEDGYENLTHSSKSLMIV